MRITTSREDGYSLIELMITLSIVGALAAVAIPSFTKYLRDAKTAEAVTGIRKIYEGARTYFMQETTCRGCIAPLPRQFPDSAAATPALDSCCAQPGGKCAPDPVAWEGPTWTALAFSVDDPHYYWYELVSTGSATTGVASSFTAVAQGNLDCDATYSRFEMVGAIHPDGSVTGSAGLYKDAEYE